ncbi:unnamed protein product [Gadus morhua 'NCC']
MYTFPKPTFIAYMQGFSWQERQSLFQTPALRLSDQSFDHCPPRSAAPPLAGLQYNRRAIHMTERDPQCLLGDTVPGPSTGSYAERRAE